MKHSGCAVYDYCADWTVQSEIARKFVLCVQRWHIQYCEYFLLVLYECLLEVFFFSSRRRHTRFDCDWSSDVCSSDLHVRGPQPASDRAFRGQHSAPRFRDRLPHPVERGGTAPEARARRRDRHPEDLDRKSTRLNSSHSQISYAVFCLKKKKYTIKHAV